MINLLRRIFIKNYKNIEDEKVRNSHCKLSGILGVLFNIILAGIKLFAGIISGSISIIADSINNLADMGSSIINLIGIKLSSKPADDDHPYGHERIEYIIGLIISVLILIVGGQMFYNSILKIISPVSIDVRLLVLIILGVSVLIKLFMSIFNYKIGKLVDSIAVKALAVDCRNDCISTFAVLIGIVFYYYTGFVYIDGIVGVLVSLFILISGISLIKETSSPLIGEVLPKEKIDEIIKDIKRYDICEGVHDITCHMYGSNKTFMSIHVEVSSSLDILYIHEEIDKIENEINKKHKIDLVIHMDPIEAENEEVIELKKKYQKALKSIDKNLKLHDFRIVKKRNSKNIIFDCLKPRDIILSDSDITKMMYEVSDENDLLVIKYEYGYIDIEDDE